MRSLLSPLRRMLPRAAAVATLSLTLGLPALAETPIKIGLVAALSGQSAKSGEALTRGLTVAIDEINAGGGILGRPVELIRRDDESNPAKGMLAARELIQREQVTVLFGGLDTPVSLAIVPLANQLKVPFMGIWAAGTKITVNGAKDNYVFRVSAVDELVDEALVDYGIKQGMQKPGMILINNPWGESNEIGFKAALEKRGMPYAGIERIEDSDLDVVPQLTRLKNAGTDTLLMVGNVGPSAQVVKSLDRMGWDVPVVSHWGPAGGRFSELAGPNASRVHFIQTYVFTEQNSAKGDAVLAALKQRFPEIKSLADVTPAVGIANAYDAMHLAAAAIEKAGGTQGTQVRDGFYAIERYEGLIKDYQQPFTPSKHDALGPDDYVFTHFVDGRIVPLAP
ncbi:MAG: ABC transporter substrate-binding protein [Gammaproteobacteria bacterium]|jgi:branched-chain amino acid transport system substrate-binding protein|nr:ABC transporter substrate-binding protein [Gammaproteobacteria bacterium]MBU1491744.1 ABC transporter substrate-binding protein [Gammaproteobacteria bacterium]MBU2067524.1 ABC transporter substrate-binding protein [Gammaproteobacteria bacterium]MBU2140849.1 ABC transporter substrate-binding protein [Gammaproteobacteria bacterium]MBU2215401.1 ABC transporter substrate-binding protein [Gammaproteobacteria bacterium]